MGSINLNRLRVVIAEKNLSNKWLSELLGIGHLTISKWELTLLVQQPCTTRLEDIGIDSRGSQCGYTRLDLPYKS